MRSIRVVFVLLVVVAAGLGAAAAAGAFAAAPATAGAHADPAHVARAVPQDDPTSALMRRVLIGGQVGTITPAVHQTPAVGSGAARRTALAVMPVRGHGSRVLGAALAYVTEPSLGRHRLMWLVSVDLAGGLTNPGGPDSVVLGLDNFIVAFVDAKTGRWEMTTAGNSRSLPPLPFIRG
jgi:hypothetical protein